MLFAESLQKELKVPLRRPGVLPDQHLVQRGAFVRVDTLDETCFKREKGKSECEDPVSEHTIEEESSKSVSEEPDASSDVTLP